MMEYTEEVDIEEGQSLEISISPEIVILLQEECPAGKVWRVKLLVNIVEEEPTIEEV